ncbi:MCP methyltransferase/methylesterase, CheR/CheB with PAS/PAC sensor [Candidatus Desulfosporosinus infrequens]|uniref:protein-glutamate O-methyltransferase n=1 Tax=Candidatus Desulfosporosinus infrequens TaxID=2043169 RepID=A0A2U3KC94_9FIRM|nr:MCP methyltransferase/methylesterase, CheR/CheB with PAS/PAC sensor [Candidatus Desulfosporosinus infrequens]
MKENRNFDTKERTKFTKSNDPETVSIKEDFSIVGIGASAGGVEALLAFLGNVPENCGLAFIIVQHMDQTHKSFLVEILQRVTTMKVIQVSENTSVQLNCVYVIPPNKEMLIQHGVLRLFDFMVPHTLHLPIDFFFRSLADDQQERSIAVILSGMGADGTAGLRAIKEKGGVVFIQEPSSAKFDGMPRSAIEADVADFVAAVETLPSKILSYLENKPLIDRNDQDPADKLQSSFDTIMILLRSQTGHEFSSYKKNTVYRRIERRMGIHQIDKISSYVCFLQENPHELDLLFKELLIGVTSFFREPLEWELLKDKVLPTLLAERAPSNPLRVWVSGCATGEEAYSLAIVFKEVLDQLNLSQAFSMQIFATDLDRDAIDKAREGIFSANIAEDMSSERLNRYFIKVDRGYQVVKTIRDMIIFAQQSMIKDPPFTKIDILTCRNLLIYLTPELQKKLIPLFHYSLNPGGFLFLGSAEAVGNFTDLFKPVDRKSRLYQRLQPLLQTEPVEFPTFFAPAQTAANIPIATVQNMQSLADKLIMQCYAPPTVLANSKGDILYITGRTGKYLEPAAGKVNWNIFAMAREGLNYKLSNTFYKALRQKEVVTYKNAVVRNEGGSQMVDITVNPLKEPEALRGMVMIIFTDVITTQVIETSNTIGRIPANSQREAELERELMQARQVWKATNTEMQISQEELKSSNEELQSSNEELQSTNEELTTTKEEVQSLNEELKTVNYELQSKLDDLSLATNDMKNLLDSTKIATLFLDNSLCVKRFTDQMSVVSKLISSDVGRPITDIASDLFYPELTEDVREVLRTLNTIEKQVRSYNGCWFNARILPYRTLEDKIDGVVITFVNITESKVLEAELRKTKSALEQHLVDQREELVQVNGIVNKETIQGYRQVAVCQDPELRE